MKKYSYKQLQIFTFTALFALFGIVGILNRALIHNPQIEKSLAKLSERELDSLYVALEANFEPLKTITYDYAVWDDTYQFAQDENQDYIVSNWANSYLDKINLDYVAIVRKDLTLAYAKKSGRFKREYTKFNWEESGNSAHKVLDFQGHSEHHAMIPEYSDDGGLAQKSGFVMTYSGPAMFSSMNIVNSDESGAHAGTVVFMRLLSQDILDNISRFIQADVSVSPLKPEHLSLDIKDLVEKNQLTKVTPVSYRFLSDINDHSVAVLSIKHSNGTLPSIFDKNLIFAYQMLATLLLIIYIFVTKFFVKPIEEISREIRQIEPEVSLEKLEKEFVIDELQYMQRSFNKLMDKIRSQQDQLSKQAYIDELTQLPNRRSFEKALTNFISQYKRHDLEFGMVILDVDYFKKYNDTLGHRAGDEALQKVAKILGDSCKRQGDLCARYGGEEFVILMHCNGPDALEKKLEQIRASFAKANIPHPTSDVAPYLSVSMGALYLSKGVKLGLDFKAYDLVELADQELYHAKEEGRNRASLSVVHDSSALQIELMGIESETALSGHEAA